MHSPKIQPRLVVIGRDGVLNDQLPGRVNHRTALGLRPERIAQIAAMSNDGFTIVLMAKQPGLSLGTLDLDELEAIHAQIYHTVEVAGGEVNAMFYCAHEAREKCYCRAPNTGLIDVIAIEYDLSANDIICISADKDEQAAATTAGCHLIEVDPSESADIHILTQQLLASLC